MKQFLKLSLQLIFLSMYAFLLHPKEQYFVPINTQQIINTQYMPNIPERRIQNHQHYDLANAEKLKIQKLAYDGTKLWAKEYFNSWDIFNLLSKS